MNLTEKTIASEQIFSGKIITVKRDTALLPNGEQAFREVVMHPGGVCVAALTDKGEVLAVRQFRYPYSEVLLEIPAGKRDKSGEDPLECGKRELKEETGATAENYYPLGVLYPSPGYCDEKIYMFAATNLSYGECNPDDDEFLEVEKIPLEDFVNMILEGKITDAKTQAAVLKLNALIQKGEIVL